MQRILILAAIAFVAFATPICADEEGTSCTRNVGIGCIETYHDAMEQACHKYMPAGDYETVRKHVPNMLAAANAIAEFQLDSTYAPVAEEFEAKREAFLLAVNELKIAADGDDDDALKTAFDNMHSAFARMNAVLAVSPPELEEFHVMVAKVWHDYLPAKDYDSIEIMLADLRNGCSKLKAAKLHPARKNVQKEYIAAVADIQESIDNIEDALDSESDEKIADAVESFHNCFVQAAVLF